VGMAPGSKQICGLRRFGQNQSFGRHVQRFGEGTDGFERGAVVAAFKLVEERSA
jgi:hypothetical protein